MLTTLLKPDGGTARVLGVDVRKDPQRVRSSIGLAGQYAAVDENLTGRENLIMVGRLTHQSRAQIPRRAAELLERFRAPVVGGVLVAAANAPTRQYYYYYAAAAPKNAPEPESTNPLEGLAAKRSGRPDGAEHAGAAPGADDAPES
jgi:hypothetical protein